MLGVDHHGVRLESAQERPASIKGYPVNGYWLRPSKWADANGDGIITPNEVTVPGRRWARSATPPSTSATRSRATRSSISNGLDLFGRKLRIRRLFDYKGGFSACSTDDEFLCQQSNFCYDVERRSEFEAAGRRGALSDQARNVAQRTSGREDAVGYSRRPVLAASAR